MSSDITGIVESGGTTQPALETRTPPTIVLLIVRIICQCFAVKESPFFYVDFLPLFRCVCSFS